MLRTIVNNQEIEVLFKHYVKDDPAPHTECAIVTPQKTYRGSAYCHNGDQYNRAVGRKIALARALYMAYPDNKDARTAVWSEYFAKAKV